MSFFQKIKSGANRFFTKLNSDKGLFNKIGNTIRQSNQSIQRLGNFLLPAVNMINPTLGGALASGLELTKTFSNDLEKGAKRADKFHKGTFNHSLVPNVDYL